MSEIIQPSPPSRGKWWIALVAIVVAGGGAYALTRGGGQPATTVTVRTAKVLVGSVRSGLARDRHDSGADFRFGYSAHDARAGLGQRTWC